MATADHVFRIAMQRFGLGATPGSRARFGNDPRAALLAEIDPAKLLIPTGDLPSTARGIQIVTEIEERRREMRAANRQIAQAKASLPTQSAGSGMEAGMPAVSIPAAPTSVASAPVASNSGASPTEAAAPKLPQPAADPDGGRTREITLAEARVRMVQGCAAETGFGERWVAFWSNHFCIALRRGNILPTVAGAYERKAIRPHAFGRFAEMLVAVETHPAMLHYLDQRQSIGPGSPAGQRRKRGLNENLAREILELHTLGVGGGYSQADVTNFAKVLTGWSISNFEENIDGYGGFFYAPNRHEPGPHAVLGQRYPQDGKEQGVAVLNDLARHPSTAAFLARKLARHFVADAPPAALVAKLEQAFRASDGDLAALARVLLNAEEAWSAPPAKLRTPYEFLLATLRATGEKPEKMPALLSALNLMGQPLWDPSGPNGHLDDEASVLAPKAIKTRLEFSMQAGRQIGGRLDPRELAETLYGVALTPETKQAIARAETRPQGIAILLMSPEFQRR